jgi:hypothetical protein
VNVARSAAARRLERNAAIVAAHPRWLGIRHPELLEFPTSRRYSQLDVVRVTRRGPLLLPPPSDRAAYSRAVVAAHPRWRGITHPERIVFAERPYMQDPLATYQAAVLRALRGVRESERLCAEISAVAEAIDRRSWPWGASPDRLLPLTKPSSRPSLWDRARPLAARLRRDRPTAGPHRRPAVRPIAH